MNRLILPRQFRKGGTRRQFPTGTAALIFRKARNATGPRALFRRPRTPLTPRIARSVSRTTRCRVVLFFCGCFQTLDPLSHPPPFSLLERARIAPRLLFFGAGHLLRPTPVPGNHRRRQRVDLGARDETRPDAALPQHPQKRAPDRTRCRGDANPDYGLFGGIHPASGGGISIFKIIWKSDYCESPHRQRRGPIAKIAWIGTSQGSHRPSHPEERGRGDDAGRPCCPAWRIPIFRGPHRKRPASHRRCGIS